MPTNKPTYRVAKPNPMFTDEQMVLVRFVKFKQPVECAHCKKRRKNHWTSLIPFRAVTFESSFALDTQSGPLLPGLTPVCGDHLLADDPVIMDEMHTSFRYYFNVTYARLAREHAAKQKKGAANAEANT